jgi:hypothetical protein
MNKYINIQEFYDNEVLYPAFVKALDKMGVHNITVDIIKQNIIRNNEKNIENNFNIAITDSLNIIYPDKIHKPNDIGKIEFDEEINENEFQIHKIKKISDKYEANIAIIPMILDENHSTVITYINNSNSTINNKTIILGYNGQRYYSLQNIPLNLNQIIEFDKNS